MPVQTRKWSQKFVEDAISAGGRGSTSVALSSSGWVRYFRCSHVMFSKVYSIVMYFAQINKVESGNGKKVVDSCSFNKPVISPTDGNMNDMSSFSCVACVVVFVLPVVFMIQLRYIRWRLRFSRAAEVAKFVWSRSHLARCWTTIQWSLWTNFIVISHKLIWKEQQTN